MKKLCVLLFFLVLPSSSVIFAQPGEEYATPQGEQQLPTAMHSPMEEGASITVGHEDADLIGKDNRVLQAAVDYIASLGGGTVHIAPGEYTMRDSLHLRNHVKVVGVEGKTVLRKAEGVKSNLAMDGDYGEEQITVEDPHGFEVGYGVTIRDDGSGGFHTTVATITGRSGNTFSISKPLNADCMVRNKAYAATVFPVVSGYHVEGVHLENLTIEGNRENNIHLNGCRGAGIFLFRGHGTTIENCVVRGYNGDGISFQQSNEVTVTNCLSENNASLGFHPGSGSQRPHVRECRARRNGTDGLFLCWRVRHGVFENNRLLENGRFGISIGHKDSDNILRKNLIRDNHENGVFFRLETFPMSPHRNVLEENVIENNGHEPGTAAIRIRGEPTDLEFIGNIIRDTRPASQRTQTVGFLLEENVRTIKRKDNEIEAEEAVVDKRNPDSD